MANLFGLRPLMQPSEGYYGQVQTPGIRPEVPSSPPLAGRFGGFDLDEAKKYKDALGEIGPYAYMLDQKLRYENDPQRLREQLEVLGPYMKDVARERQRLGMESNVFAGLMNLPNKWQEAMSEKYRFSGPIVDMIKQGSQRTAANPFVTRQYINI